MMVIVSHMKITCNCYNFMYMKISSFHAKAHLIFHWRLYKSIFILFFKKACWNELDYKAAYALDAQCTSYVKRGKCEQPKLKLMVHLQTIVIHNKIVKAMFIDENDVQM